MNKKINKEEFLILFSCAFDTNIENILKTKTKHGIGGGFRFTKFYEQIQKILIPGSYIEREYNELECILKFFNDKCYEKIEFPKDGEILFSLLKFAQSGYKPLPNIKKFTDSCVKFLGDDVFLETVLSYFGKKNTNEEDLTIKQNIFKKNQLDFYDPYFIINAFDIIYKKHKNIEEKILEKQIVRLLSGRLSDNGSLYLYKKLEKIDKYIKTSSFASQFCEYNEKNEKFLSKLKEYKTKSYYKELNDSLLLK